MWSGGLYSYSPPWSCPTSQREKERDRQTDRQTDRETDRPSVGPSGLPGNSVTCISVSLFCTWHWILCPAPQWKADHLTSLCLYLSICKRCEIMQATCFLHRRVVRITDIRLMLSAFWRVQGNLEWETLYGYQIWFPNQRTGLSIYLQNQGHWNTSFSICYLKWCPKEKRTRHDWRIWPRQPFWWPSIQHLSEGRWLQASDCQVHYH